MFIVLMLLPCIRHVILLLNIYCVVFLPHINHCVLTIGNLGKFIPFFVFVNVWSLMCYCCVWCSLCCWCCFMHLVVSSNSNLILPFSCFCQCLVLNVLLLPNVHHVIITTRGRYKLWWFNIDKNYIPYKSIQDSLKWFKWTWLLLLKTLLF
jgi:hypothetical protein